MMQSSIASKSSNADLLPNSTLQYLCRFARQKKSWSPRLLLSLLWRAVWSLRSRHVLRAIVTFPEYRELLRTDPRFRFRYLARNYLSRRLTVTERTFCFSHHYKWLHDHLSSALLSKVLYGSVPLIKIAGSGRSYTIRCGTSRPIDTEGELSLSMEADGETIFILSFSIIPGRVVRSDSTDALLITRMQGTKGCFNEISLATKAMRYVAPPALLVAVLEGFGIAFGIRTLACVSGTDQTSYCWKRAAVFKAAYDAFFIDRGVAKNNAHLFVSMIPMNMKPLSAIKRGHKLRAKRRRELKRLIAEATQQSLRDQGGDNGHNPVQIRLDRI